MEIELLESLVKALTTGALGAAGASLFSYFVAQVKAVLGKRPPDEVVRRVADFGNLSPGRIRQVVQAQLVDKGKLAASKRDELVTLMVNFARGARLATSEGTLGGSVATAGARSELLAQILAHIQPTRAVGQAVSEKKHHDWVLEKYLGSGAFGEVWLGKSKDQSLLKYAFKFFVNDRAGGWLEKEKDNLARVQKTLHGDPHIVHLIDIARRRSRSRIWNLNTCRAARWKTGSWRKKSSGQT